MAWFVKSRLLLKVTTGLSAGVSAIVLAISTSDVNGNTWTRSTRDKFALGKVSATWTTSFQPTIYWDKNWDRYLYLLRLQIHQFNPFTTKVFIQKKFHTERAIATCLLSSESSNHPYLDRLYLLFMWPRYSKV